MAVPVRETIRRREVARLIGGMRRVRAVLISIGVAGLVWVLWRDALDWALVTPTVAIALLIPIVIIDIYRLRGPELRNIAGVSVDLFLGLIAQTAVVAITGGIESPMLFVLVVMPVGAATVLGPSAKSHTLLACALLVPWFFVYVGAHHLMPGTLPRLLDLDPGFADRLPYAASRAVAVNLACIIMFRLGLVFFNTINRMIDAALEAKREALQTQQDRNRELVHLSSAIAHELKNPLASIKGLVQLLQRGGRNSERRFEVLQQEVDRTRRTLDEFLNFTRPLGALTVHEVSVADLLSELTALHEGIAANSGVSIVPPHPTQASLSADRRKLAQALSNLLHNALEASKEQQSVRWVVQDHPEHLIIGVADEGPGMDDAVKNRAHEVGATTKPGGSGIGLAVARTIAEQHGGQLLIDNPDKGGCVATLRLPKSPQVKGPRAE